MHFNKILAIIILQMFMVITAPAQLAILNYNFSFDQYNSPTDNEFVHNFNGMYHYKQIPNNGISGGCLELGTELLGYPHVAATRLKDSFPVYSNTFLSLCFRYVPSTTIHESAVGLVINGWTPYGSPTFSVTSYLIKSGLNPDRINNFTHSFSSAALWVNHVINEPIPGNWYRLQLDFNGISYNIQLYNLGRYGTSTPQFVSGSAGPLSASNDSDPDDKITVGLFGAYNSGGEYVDNFTASIIYADPLSVDRVKADQAITMPTLVNSSLPIHLSAPLVLDYAIHNTNGTLVKQGNLKGDQTINIDALTQGTYYISFMGKSFRHVKKFIKQ